MRYIACRTDDGKNIGKIYFYCKALEVSRQAFYDYLGRKDAPWKYQPLADAMLKIHDEDEENADYGRVRMYQALKYKKEVGRLDGITKADHEARKSDDLLKRDFTAAAPLKKCVTDITEIPENCMFRRSLIAMICCRMVLPWQIICEPSSAVKH